MSCWSRCLGIGLILVVIGGASAPAVRGHDDDDSHHDNDGSQGAVFTVENESGRATTINVADFPVVARTNPFFLDLGINGLHNGSAASLRDVVNFYDVRFSLGLTDQQKLDLVAFLRTL